MRVVLLAQRQLRDLLLVVLGQRSFVYVIGVVHQARFVVRRLERHLEEAWVLFPFLAVEGMRVIDLVDHNIRPVFLGRD